MSGGRAYLDYNASAPLRPEARAALAAALDCDGNPSSVHAEGRRARSIVELARERVAALVGARSSEVVFTSGATEANNAVVGATWNNVVLSQMEHDSVLAPARASGARLIEIGAGFDGIARVADIASRTAASFSEGGRTLVSLQMANNETGVIQPVAEAAPIAREQGHFVHTDAVQAAGRIAIDFHGLGVDFLTLSSHKLGGPKGVGTLVIRDRVTLPALLSGGGQERRRRAGTENVAAIAGFGAAAEAARAEVASMAPIARLRDTLEQEILQITPAAIIVGANAPRLANTSCIALPSHAAEMFVIKLDLAGIAVSAGAACSSGKVGTSHVLLAMGLAPEIARSAIRVSLGYGTTEHDIKKFLEAWRAICLPAGVKKTAARPTRARTSRAVA